MILKIVEFEKYEESVKNLPMPEAVYCLCWDEGRDVVLIYDDNRVFIQEAV